MEKFLSKAASKLITENYSGPYSVVILPNRRSEVFLKQEIKKINDSNIWLPEFYPIDEFFQKVSRIRKADNITTWFELFDIYKETEGKGAKSIDEFLSWAPMILNDFNDLDNSMADAKDMYSQLSAIKALENWNLNTKPLTESQENYIRFYNSMFDFYEGLNTSLKSKGTGYQGLINRHLAENIQTLTEDLKWKKFLIIGINALSEAEIKVFSYLKQNFKTEFLWDLDEYYFNNSQQKFQHEAGKHIKYAIDRLKIELPDEIESNLTQQPKQIRAFGTPKNIGQVKFIGQELLHNDNLKGTNTAIVLGNENLIIPLLNSLPDKDGEINYNLTLGYPLAVSQVDHFFGAWLDVIESTDYHKLTINTNTLINFLNNPISRQLLDVQKPVSEKLLHKILYLNIHNISFKELISAIGEFDKKACENIASLLMEANSLNIVNSLERLSSLITTIPMHISSDNLLLSEQVHALIKILGKLVNYAQRYSNDINIMALRKIGKQIIGQQTINLIGEPLQGIQIMGMLETRTLDFDNIYILSVNEGTLPKTSSMDTFIPFDIRREFKLPLPSDKSDIYSYHFFRLLQRGKNITLIYNSDAEKLGGGEKSRFILQIENELANRYNSIKYSSKVINTELVGTTDDPVISKKIIIKKSDDILEKIADISVKGYSASLLISYITCHLKFYFQQILRLKTDSTKDQSIEPNTFGTVIHDVFEKIYKPYVGQTLDPKKLKTRFGDISELLLTGFAEHAKSDNLKSGKNLLFFEVAKKYVSSFMKWDIENIPKADSVLLGTEKEIVTEISDGFTKINIKGTLDRVERLVSENTIRITDYKTGKVSKTELIVKDVDDLFSNPDKSKAFQVLFYAWLYHLTQESDSIQTGIISMRNLSNGFIPLIIKEFDSISEYFEDFQKAIIILIREISDKEIPFTQTTDSERCKYCDFKSLCNKAGD